MTDLAPALDLWVRGTRNSDTPITAIALPARSNNRSFRLAVGDEWYVLKLIHPERAAAVEHELAILPYLHAHGFPVSEVLAIGHGLPGVPETVVLRSYLIGSPASERYAQLPPIDRRDMLGKMGALLARIHTIPIGEVAAFWQFPQDTVHTPADWATNFIQKKVASDLGVLLPSNALPRDISRQMASLLPSWAQTLRRAAVLVAPLHGDFYLDNVLIADDGTISGVLDWEAARLGDPLWELARTQVASFADTPTQWEDFLAGYTRAFPVAVDARRVVCYRFLMAMGDLRYAVRHAPDLIPPRAAHLTAFWRLLMEGDAWS